MAPLAASIALFGGYLLIKFFPEFSLQTLLNIYFGILGTYSVASSLGPFLKKIDFLNQFQLRLTASINNKNKKTDSDSEHTEVTDVIAIIIGLVLIYYDFKSGHSNFTINNLIATLIVTDILQVYF